MAGAPQPLALSALDRRDGTLRPPQTEELVKQIAKCAPVSQSTGRRVREKWLFSFFVAFCHNLDFKELICIDALNSAQNLEP